MANPTFSRLSNGVDVTCLLTILGVILYVRRRNDMAHGPLGQWFRSCSPAETDLRPAVPSRDAPCPLLQA